MPTIELVLKLQASGVKSGLSALESQIRSMGRADIGRAFSSGMKEAVTAMDRYKMQLAEIKKQRDALKLSHNSANIGPSGSAKNIEATREYETALKALDIAAKGARIELEKTDPQHIDATATIARNIDAVEKYKARVRELNALKSNPDVAFDQRDERRAAGAERGKMQSATGASGLLAGNDAFAAKQAAATNKWSAAQADLNAKLQLAHKLQQMGAMDSAEWAATVTRLEAELKQVDPLKLKADEILKRNVPPAKAYLGKLRELKAMVKGGHLTPELAKNEAAMARAKAHADIIKGFSGAAQKAMLDATNTTRHLKQALEDLKEMKKRNILTDKEFADATALVNRRMNETTKAGKKMGPAMMQAGYAGQDFIQVIGQTGVAGALHASANNMSQFATVLWGANGAILGIGITAAAVLIPMLTKSSSAATMLKNAVESLTESLKNFRNYAKEDIKVGELLKSGTREELLKRKKDLKEEMKLESDVVDKAAKGRRALLNQAALGSSDKPGGMGGDFVQSLGSVGKGAANLAASMVGKGDSVSAKTELDRIGSVLIDDMIRRGEGDKKVGTGGLTANQIREQGRHISSSVSASTNRADVARQALNAGEVTESQLKRAIGKDEVKKMAKGANLPEDANLDKAMQKRQRRELEMQKIDAELAKIGRVTDKEKLAATKKQEEAAKKLADARESMIKKHRTALEIYQDEVAELERILDPMTDALTLARGKADAEERYNNAIKKGNELTEKEKKIKSEIASIIKANLTPQEQFEAEMERIAQARVGEGRVAGMGFFGSASADRAEKSAKEKRDATLDSQKAPLLAHLFKALPENKMRDQVDELARAQNAAIDSVNKQDEQGLLSPDKKREALDLISESTRVQGERLLKEKRPEARQSAFMGIEGMARTIQQNLVPTQQELETKKQTGLMQASLSRLDDLVKDGRKGKKILVKGSTR